jgi:hypothetical protein
LKSIRVRNTGFVAKGDRLIQSDGANSNLTLQNLRRKKQVKSLKTLGLTVLTMLMAMALVCTSSAIAEETALCKADENPCKESNLVTHLHEATLAESPAQLLSNLGNVKCDVLFLSTSVGSPATSQVILGNFTYSNCFRKKLKGEESCTVSEKNGPAEIKVTKTSHETAKVTGKGEVEVLCGSFIQCVYNGEGLEATAKGPLLSSETNGEVSLSEQETHKVSGTLCPGEAELDITTTPLEATYISSGVVKETGETVQLCKVDEALCQPGNVVTHVHEETLSGSPALLLNSLGNVKCTALFLSLTVGSLEMSQIITGHFTYTGCKRKKLIGEEECTVTEKTGTTSTIKILKAAAETVKVTGEGEVRVQCGSFIDCTYNGVGLEATGKGALISTETNGETSISEQTTHKVSGAFCPEEAKLDIKTTPLPNKVYITS